MLQGMESNSVISLSSSCKKIAKEFKKVKISSKNMHKNVLLKAEKLCCLKSSF